MLVSSAKSVYLTSEETLQMSLMYKRNNFGPKIDPCGTPHIVCISLDIKFFPHILLSCCKIAL